MKVEAPGSAVKWTVVSERKVSFPVVRSRSDFVAIDCQDTGAFAGFVTGEVVAGHSALLLRW